MGASFSRTNKQRVIATRSQLDEEINLFLSETRPSPSTNPIDQQYNQLISTFLEIAVDQTVETARSFLETTNWNIGEAINLFLVGNNYDPSMHRRSDEQESDSTVPQHLLLFEGSFEDAKSVSSQDNLWLLVNLQSRTGSASQTLDQDIDSAPPVVLLIDPITGQKMRMWSGEIEAQGFVEDLMQFSEAGPHEHVASLIRNRSPETNEGLQIGTTYEIPAPSWGEEFEKEDTCSSSDSIDHQTVSPSCGEEFENEETLSSSNNYDHMVAPSWGPEFEESAEVKEEEETCLEFPDLTEEPKGDCDRSLVCSLCVRFPDGRRKQRKFLNTEPIQLLWSFCYFQMETSEKKAFKLVQAIPGASKTLGYEANTTFDQSGLANSMISVTWE
ncbi:unnamed protein product [Thlaspi arvense]|uniref:UBX domain-containing protein n=1 Tax=Thlaspi arvense TaxID=13288 RepID=A0AAU9T9V6_THLAR|nr:unnamed protein product [Thlaspi arvense]